MENKCKECGTILPQKKVIEIKHKITGKVLKTIRGESLRYADLRGANLRDAKTRMCTVNFSSDEYEQAKQFIEGLKL